jgi:hypothetical protein
MKHESKMTVLPRRSCLQNIKVLSSMIPTQGNHFLIWEQNIEFRRGRGNGWFLVCFCADDEDDNVAFSLEI